MRSTLDTGGGLALTRRGLAPRKIRRALPGAITPASAAEERGRLEALVRLVLDDTRNMDVLSIILETWMSCLFLSVLCSSVCSIYLCVILRVQLVGSRAII